MADIVDTATRSRMMAGIKGKNTKPELLVRKGLHALGFRFRLHSKDVPGKPDLVLRKYRAAVFVHGCFWHGHDCHLFKMPTTRTDFWGAKINRNRERDQEVRSQLIESNWRRLVIWECALKGKTRMDFDFLLQSVAKWLRGRELEFEIAGGRA
ncbi:MAG: very short patch repair endonuclease [Pseudomonadota bacterium]